MQKKTYTGPARYVPVVLLVLLFLSTGLRAENSPTENQQKKWPTQPASEAVQLLTGANHYFARNQFDKARPFYENAILLYPNYPLALALHGNFLLATGEYKLAAFEIRKAIEIAGITSQIIWNVREAWRDYPLLAQRIKELQIEAENRGGEFLWLIGFYTAIIGYNRTARYYLGRWLEQNSNDPLAQKLEHYTQKLPYLPLPHLLVDKALQFDHDQYHHIEPIRFRFYSQMGSSLLLNGMDNSFKYSAALGLGAGLQVNRLMADLNLNVTQFNHQGMRTEIFCFSPGFDLGYHLPLGQGVWTNLKVGYQLHFLQRANPNHPLYQPLYIWGHGPQAGVEIYYLFSTYDGLIRVPIGFSLSGHHYFLPQADGFTFSGQTLNLMFKIGMEM